MAEIFYITKIGEHDLLSFRLNFFCAKLSQRCYKTIITRHSYVVIRSLSERLKK